MYYFLHFSESNFFLLRSSTLETNIFSIRVFFFFSSLFYFFCSRCFRGTTEIAFHQCSGTCSIAPVEEPWNIHLHRHCRGSKGKHKPHLSAQCVLNLAIKCFSPPLLFKINASGHKKLQIAQFQLKIKTNLGKRPLDQQLLSVQHISYFHFPGCACVLTYISVYIIYTHMYALFLFSKFSWIFTCNTVWNKVLYTFFPERYKEGNDRSLNLQSL